MGDVKNLARESASSSLARCAESITDAGGASNVAPGPFEAARALEQAAADHISTAAAAAAGGRAADAAAAQRAAVLRLWAGDAVGALHTVLRADALTPDFVSMTASAGAFSVVTSFGIE